MNGENSTAKIPAGDRAGTVLSFGQERLWLAYLLEPHSAVYNITLCFRLKGNLNLGALEESLREILRRHESLRTAVAVRDGEPYQQVMAPYQLKVAITDLRDLAASIRMTQALEYATHESSRPFDLTSGRVFRASLFTISDEEHLLLFVVHHIAFDGWSVEVFMEELGHFYNSICKGRLEPLPPPPLTYSEFSARQREFARSEEIRRPLDYWREQLANPPPPLEFPTDHKAPRIRSSFGATARFEISPQTTEGLRRLGKSEGATLYMVLLAAFAALISRYTAQDDIILGTPVAGRTQRDLEGLIGFFVNTLPLRISTAGDPPFRELLRAVRAAVIGGLARQDVPYERVLEELGISHGYGKIPLFNTLFAYEPPSGVTGMMTGLQTSMIGIDTDTAKFDLSLTIKDNGSVLLAAWEYSTELFERDTIARMAAHYSRILDSLANDPQTRLSDLAILTVEERNLLLFGWNATEREYPRKRCIHELFEEVAKNRPDQIALVAGQTRMSYGELNRRANQLAHWLQREGVREDVLVGICVDRSVDMLVGMLGILKAGGAYVPLPPDFPQDRVRRIADDAHIELMLSQGRLASTLASHGVRTFCLDTQWTSLAGESEEDPHATVVPESLAYVMYTSGSTGTPKGVCIPHRGVVRLVKGSEFASLGPNEVFLQLSTFAFDASTFEIWGSLLHGASLVVPPPGVLSARELGTTIRDNNVTTLWLTAGLFHSIVDSGLDALDGLKQLLVGGDVVSPSHAARFKSRYPGCRLINGYGPTENTTFTCCYEISGKESGPLPIGKPIANTAAYVLDENMRPVPVGIKGELYTAGDGLARGYLNDEPLTREKFVPSPFDDRRFPRLYRTGDVVRYLPDGTIMFEGRKDNQVKVNGYRIEIDEVEMMMRSHPELAQAAVVPRAAGNGDKRLVGYYVAAPGREVSSASVREHMERRLPGFMVPSAFVCLPELPLTPQGKVDRQRLPDPESAETLVERIPVVPRDPLETLIRDVWVKLFGIQSIGVTDSFFELGGHSLLAFRIFAELEKHTGVNLPLASLFAAPTIEQLAAIIRQKGWRRPLECLVPIKPGGSRLPIFFIHAVGGNVLGFHELARHLSPDQPVYGLQSVGLDGKEQPLTRIEDMAGRYIEEIRTLQPRGPYSLSGMSFGGIVAFEMARQLADTGEEVGLLALLDTFSLSESRLHAVWDKWVGFGERIRLHARNLADLPAAEKANYVVRSGKTLARRVMNRYRKVTFKIDDETGVLLTSALQAVKDTNLLAARKYQLRPYKGTITFFLAADRTSEGLPNPVDQWGAVADGGVEVVEVPGDHHSMMSSANIGTVARRLDERLDRVNEHASAGGTND